MEKLNDRVINLAERTVIDALKTCNVDYNKASIKGALCSVVNSLLFSILEDESKIRKSFESAIVQVAASVKMVSRTAKAIVADAVVGSNS